MASLHTFITFLLLLLHLFFSKTSSSDLASDASALLAFKNSFSPSILPSWNNSSTICSSWTGVLCSNSSSPRVSSLRLPVKSLIGPLPASTLGLLDALDALSLRDNRLSGSLPLDLANCTSLTRLYLQNNAFSGPLPFDFSTFPLLQQLDLSFNNFIGSIPAPIGSLAHLKSLYLQNNSFSGALPPMIVSLRNLNVSFNQLNGSIPSTLSGFSADSFSGNNLCGSPLLACPQSNRKRSTGAIVGIVFGCVAFFVLALLLCFCLLRGRTTRKGREERKDFYERGRSDFFVRKQPAPPISTSDESKQGKSTDQAIRKKRQEEHKLIFIDKRAETFDLEGLLRASAEVLGKGSLGTVYKAGMSDGLVLAVKRIRYELNDRDQYRLIMHKIGNMRHENLVPMRAYYLATQEKLLVSDYMPYGSLSALLHGNPSSGRIMLDWDARVSIALDAARGLAYLHRNQFVHGNLKSSNVLLTKNYDGRLADYGLVLLVSLPLENIKVAGYMAPEVTDLKKITEESDVYSFGVLLLELLTGKAPSHASMDDQYGVDLPTWVQSMGRKRIFDPELLEYQNHLDEEMMQLLQVALPCVRPSPDQRPTMEEIVEVIENVRKTDEEEASAYFDQYPETMSEVGVQ